MSRFEQRAKTRLQNRETRSGYRQLDAEIALLTRLDEARRELGISQKELSTILTRSQSAVSQFFSGRSGVTIDRVVEYLAALGLQARIELVQAPENAPSLVIAKEPVAPALRRRRARKSRQRTAISVGR